MANKSPVLVFRSVTPPLRRHSSAFTPPPGRQRRAATPPLSYRNTSVSPAPVSRSVSVAMPSTCNGYVHQHPTARYSSGTTISPSHHAFVRTRAVSPSGAVCHIRLARPRSLTPPTKIDPVTIAAIGPPTKSDPKRRALPQCGASRGRLLACKSGVAQPKALQPSVRVAQPQLPSEQVPFPAQLEEVLVNGYTLRLASRLGRGSVCSVWGAMLDNGDEAVFREVFCRSSAELVAASFEGHLLRDLCPNKKGFIGRSELRIPSLLAMHVEQPSDSSSSPLWRVRFAMTRVPGTPLEDFLSHRTWVKQPNFSRNLFDQVLNACTCTWELLAQLVPLLEQVSHHAHHREVTARNVLIEDREGRQPRFGLAGFGRASNELCWQVGEAGPDLVGDGRYWPACVWQALANCNSVLSDIPMLGHAHGMSFDVHALGVTALRCLVCMLPDFSAAIKAAQGPVGTHIALAQLWVLQGSFEKYWSTMASAWRELWCNANPAVALGAHASAIAADLDALQAALRETREVWLRMPKSEGSEVAVAALEVIHVALGGCGVTSWVELRRLLQCGGCTAGVVPSPQCESAASTASPADSAPATSPSPSLPSSPPLSLPASPRSPASSASPTSRTPSFGSYVLRSITDLDEPRDHISDDAEEHVSV